jgi:hypothetical protein
MKIAILCLAFLLSFSTPSLAGVADLADTVTGHPGMTYFTLMKLVVTDLGPIGKSGAVGHEVVPFVHIDGKDARGDPPDPIILSNVETLPIPGDDSRIVLLADLGQADGQVGDAQLLALFALARAPKLLDIVEVGADRFTGFDDAHLSMLAPRTPLILIYNTHSNSEQTYFSTKMMFVRGDRFQLIDNVFSFGERYCSYERAQDQSFQVFPSLGPYAAVHAFVTERVKLTGAQCGEEKAPPPHVAIHQANYRWDPRRHSFTTQSKALDQLAKQDFKRF